MDVQIFPRRLRGTVTPPPSKSLAHRVVLAELLSEKAAFSVSPDLSEDIRATVRCAAALRTPGPDLPVLDCGESGSTLRFLIPTALALRGGGVFTGRGRLMDRPLTPYFALFDEKGIAYERRGDALTVRGTLPPGEYRLSGNVSSQFVTGLLYALPLLDGDSVLSLTTPLESAGYVDLTLDVLNRSEVTIERLDGRTFRVPGGQRYHAEDLPVEADWSQAAFWYAAAFLGNAVEVRGLNPASAQGDRVIADLSRTLQASGAVEIDLSGIPDLLPPLAVMAAVRDGVTRFGNAGRLRLKESDRIESVGNLLRSFDVQTESGPDWLSVTGGLHASGMRSFTGCVVDGANDHRIVMAAAVLASVWSGPVTIRGAEAVRKSYPDFFAHYEQLGGAVHVL